MLGLAYATQIDMWSLGCILVELHTGSPIFDGTNETQQLHKVMEVCGLPPAHMLAASPKVDKFFFRTNDGRFVPMQVCHSFSIISPSFLWLILEPCSSFADATCATSLAVRPVVLVASTRTNLATRLPSTMPLCRSSSRCCNTTPTNVHHRRRVPCIRSSQTRVSAPISPRLRRQPSWFSIARCLPSSLALFHQTSPTPSVSPLCHQQPILPPSRQRQRLKACQHPLEALRHRPSMAARKVHLLLSPQSPPRQGLQHCPWHHSQ